MLLLPPLLDKASAAKPSHSVRALEAAANARVAPCEKGCLPKRVLAAQGAGRQGLRPAAAATYTAAAHHSCHRQQQTQTAEASGSARRAAGTTLFRSCKLTSQDPRPAANQQNPHTNAAPCRHTLPPHVFCLPRCVPPFPPWSARARFLPCRRDPLRSTCRGTSKQI